MNKLEKFELMEKIARELEDLKNSQQAVLEKIGKIEVDNIELDDKNLEKILPDIHQRTADNHDAISSLLDDFSEKAGAFETENNIAQLREQRDAQL